MQLDRLLWAAIVHDESESHSGDMASCYKKGDVKEANSEYERRYSLGLHGVVELTDQERCILKIADFLEALLFLKEEQLMGNRLVLDVWEDVMDNFATAWERFRWAVTDEDPVKPMAHMLWERFYNVVNITRHPGMWDVK